MKNLSGWCFRLAVLYALFGMVMGEVMAVSGDHSQMPVHAHINVLGWVSLALFGVFYRLWPAATVGMLPGIQFVVFSIGIVIQSIAVSLILNGNEEVAPMAGAGSGLLIVSMALFGYLVYRHARE